MKTSGLLRSLCLITLTATLVTGCSNKEKIVLVEIEGKLMMDGKPVPLAQIDFMPEFTFLFAQQVAEIVVGLVRFI